MSAPVEPENFLFSHLTLTGTDSMDTDAAGSGRTFVYQVPVGKKAYIQRINFQITDAGVDPKDFGGITGSLTTGCSVMVLDSDGTVLKDFTAGRPIVKNGDWGRLAGVDVDRDSGAGDDQLLIRWTIAKAGGPLMLHNQEQVVLGIHDDLTGLTEFFGMVQGSERSV